MFNYNLNFIKIIKENLPADLHKAKRIDWIRSLIAPIIIVYNEFALLRIDYLYKVAYSGQVIYLEKILNDKFDNALRRIYITESESFNSNYLYRKIESKPPRYLYRNWNAATNYLVGDFAVEGLKVYKCLIDNNNVLPSTSIGAGNEWVFHDDVFIMKRAIEYGSVGFIIHVPSALVFDEIRMRALVNYYRLASKYFSIQTY